MLSMTYGTMPTREEFNSQWEKVFRESEKSTFSFGRDKRLGDCELTQDELWDELVKAHDENNELDSDTLSDWMSCVLSCLDIEWI